jgi:hypothetical protein
MVKIMFDQISFLVSDKEQGIICENAVKLSLEVNKSERRTIKQQHIILE